MCFTPAFPGPEPPSRGWRSAASVDTVFGRLAGPGQPGPSAEARERTAAGADPPLQAGL